MSGELEVFENLMKNVDVRLTPVETGQFDIFNVAER
jgi:hypothetical protein